jgi:cytochrome c oxidase subunit 4
MSEHSESFGHGDPAAHGSHDDHAGNAKYIYVFVALCVLTLMSFWTSNLLPIKWPFHDQPAVGRAFMMAVSCTKAMLVILFFMHVKYEANWKYVLTIPAGMMSLFLMLMLVPDVGMRMRNPNGGPPGVAQEQVQRLGSQALDNQIQAAARTRSGE